jgi:hypothetical protein
MAKRLAAAEKEVRAVASIGIQSRRQVSLFRSTLD